MLRTRERSANDEPESLAPELTWPGTISRDRARKPNGRAVLQVLGKGFVTGNFAFFFVVLCVARLASASPLVVVIGYSSCRVVVIVNKVMIIYRFN